MPTRLAAPGASEIALYALGAREAVAPLLLVTESHCLAHPACVEEVLEFFADGAWDGASLSCTGGSPNSLARMEQRVFDELSAEWTRPGDFRKVLLCGFAVRSVVFHADGGFDPRYGKFAERALAIALHRSGRRLSHVPRAGVVHQNTTTLRMLVPSIRDYVHGECLYRLDHPEEDGGPLLGSPAEWTTRGTAGPLRLRLLLARAAAATGSAAARCWLWRLLAREERLFVAYRAFWERTARRERLACAIRTRSH